MTQAPLPPNSPGYGYQPGGYQSQPGAAGRKSFLATWLLSLLLGGLGIDRFYLGKIGTGILKLTTAGGLGIWALVDLIVVLCGATRDKEGYLLAGYDQYKTIAWIVSLIVVVLSGGYGVLQNN